jgi:DNA-binding transcriptional MerR regulator
MTKSAAAFRTIREVAEWLDTETHVLRFWESKFSQIKPVKRAGGRRYYRPKDMLIIGGIKKLLHEDGITIKGTQRIIKDKGLSHLSGLSRPLESLEVGKTEFQEKVSRTTRENLNVKTKEEQYINKFDEVDGQFSMFSNEPLTKPSESIKPKPTYESISNILCKKTFAYSDKDLLEKILSSIDDAINKRA